MPATTLSGFWDCEYGAKLYQARRSASVVLVAPSTFVMRFRLYAIVARPTSTPAPDNPRISKRGCPKMRYLIVAKGCSTVHHAPPSEKRASDPNIVGLLLLTGRPTGVLFQLAVDFNYYTVCNYNNRRIR